MDRVTFEVGHRTTDGFPLLLALGVAALIGFMVEVTRPLAPQAAPPPPQPVEAAEPPEPMM